MTNLSIAELKLQRRWTLWRLEPGKDGKLTKPPCSPEGFKHDITNPDNLKTFADLEPLACKFSGLGFALGEFDGVSVWGVDIDKCCDAVSGKFSPESREVVIALNSYAEYSPSGTGCHIWGIGTVPGKGLQKPYPGAKQIEVKGLGYYQTYTGRHLSKTPDTLEERQEQITALYNRVQRITKPKADALTITMPASRIRNCAHCRGYLPPALELRQLSNGQDARRNQTALICGPHPLFTIFVVCWPCPIRHLRGTASEVHYQNVTNVRRYCYR